MNLMITNISVESQKNQFKFEKEQKSKVEQRLKEISEDHEQVIESLNSSMKGLKNNFEERLNNLV